MEETQRESDKVCKEPPDMQHPTPAPENDGPSCSHSPVVSISQDWQTCERCIKSDLGKPRGVVYQREARMRSRLAQQMGVFPDSTAGVALSFRQWALIGRAHGHSFDFTLLTVCAVEGGRDERVLACSRRVQDCSFQRRIKGYFTGVYAIFEGRLHAS